MARQAYSIDRKKRVWYQITRIVLYRELKQAFVVFQQLNSILTSFLSILIIANTVTISSYKTKNTKISHTSHAIGCPCFRIHPFHSPYLNKTKTSIQLTKTTRSWPNLYRFCPSNNQCCFILPAEIATADIRTNTSNRDKQKQENIRMHIFSFITTHIQLELFL